MASSRTKPATASANVGPSPRSRSCYAEPFVGMGGVCFGRRSAPTSEVINDASRDVATSFHTFAQRLGCDGDKAAFEKKLGKIATAKPGKKKGDH